MAFDQGQRWKTSPHAKTAALQNDSLILPGHHTAASNFQRDQPLAVGEWGGNIQDCWHQLDDSEVEASAITSIGIVLELFSIYWVDPIQTLAKMV